MPKDRPRFWSASATRHRRQHAAIRGALTVRSWPPYTSNSQRGVGYLIQDEMTKALGGTSALCSTINRSVGADRGWEPLSLLLPAPFGLVGRQAPRSVSLHPMA